MGTALTFGFASAGCCVKVSNRSKGRLERLSKINGVTVSLSNIEVIHDADLIVLAVQPAVLPRVIAEIGPHINYNHAIVASLSPSLTMSEFESALRVFNKAPMAARVMPNTAVSVGQSMTFVCLNEYAAAYASELEGLFNAVGKTEVVDERLFTAAMILCSCGLAYAFRYIRAASEGGVRMGFEADAAARYVSQTLRGAADMLERFNIHPEAAVDTVTTPGGITIRGLLAMEAAGFSSAVAAGLKLPGNE